MAKNYIGTTTNSAGLTTYTFSSANIGTASSDRLVVVAIHLASSGSRTISSVTIGGNSATVNTTTNVGSVNGITTVFAYLNVTTGTTANIVVTASGICLACAIDVYTLTELSSFTPTDSDLASVGANPSVTSTAVVNGYVIASVTSVSGDALSWTGPTSDSDTTFSAFNARISCASLIADATSEVSSISSTGAALRLAAVSWEKLSSVSLTVNNASHGLVSTSPSIATNNSVVISNCVHATSSTSPVIVGNTPLTLNNAFHSLTNTEPTVGENWDISIQDVFHGMSSTSPVIATNNSLIVTDTLHALSSTSPVVATNNLVLVNNSSHVVTSSSPVLISHDLIAINSCTHYIQDTVPIISKVTPWFYNENRHTGSTTLWGQSK